MGRVYVGSQFKGPSGVVKKSQQQVLEVASCIAFGAKKQRLINAATWLVSPLCLVKDPTP